MQKISLWFQKELPSLLRTLSKALLEPAVIVQIGLCFGALVVMVPLGALLTWMLRRLSSQLSLQERLTDGLDGLRALFFLAPLSEEGEARVSLLLRSLEAPLQPLAGYFFLLAVREPLVATKGFHDAILVRVAPLFLLWALYRWLVVALPAIVGPDVGRFLRLRLLRPVLWLACVLQLFNQLDAGIALLQTPLLTVAGASISLKSLFFAGFFLILFFRLSTGTREFLDAGLLPRWKLSPALRNTLATFASYVLLGVGFFLAIGALGFQGSSFTIILGALSVGIGFGLQSIINNFVSGLILLAEQSIAPGDVIEVDKHTCTVQQLRIRSTVVRTLDNVELSVPNSKLLGDIVKSYSSGDPKNRTSVRVTVHYDTDPRYVEGVLLETAHSTKGILKEPAPEVSFVDFADHTLHFDLAVWVEEPPLLAKIRSDLRFTLWYQLRRAGISLAHAGGPERPISPSNGSLPAIDRNAASMAQRKSQPTLPVFPRVQAPPRKTSSPTSPTSPVVPKVPKRSEVEATPSFRAAMAPPRPPSVPSALPPPPPDAMPLRRRSEPLPPPPIGLKPPSQEHLPNVQIAPEPSAGLRTSWEDFLAIRTTLSDPSSETPPEEEASAAQEAPSSPSLPTLDPVPIPQAQRPSAEALPEAPRRPDTGGFTLAPPLPSDKK